MEQADIVASHKVCGATWKLFDLDVGITRTTVVIVKRFLGARVAVVSLPASSATKPCHMVY